jgi:hypothetical protein
LETHGSYVDPDGASCSTGRIHKDMQEAHGPDSGHSSR